MSVDRYRKLIEEQRATGIILVRCPCGDPAVEWISGGLTCALCIKRDAVRVREYNKAEDTRRRRLEEDIDYYANK